MAIERPRSGVEEMGEVCSNSALAENKVIGCGNVDLCSESFPISGDFSRRFPLHREPPVALTEITCLTHLPAAVESQTPEGTF